MTEALISRRFEGIEDLPGALRTMAASGPSMQMTLNARTALQLARILEQHASMASATAQTATNSENWWEKMKASDKRAARIAGSIFLVWFAALVIIALVARP